MYTIQANVPRETNQVAKKKRAIKLFHVKQEGIELYIQTENTRTRNIARETNISGNTNLSVKKCSK